MDLKSIVTKAMAEVQGDIEKGLATAVAKAPNTQAPKPAVTATLTGSDAENRLQEIAFIAKSIKGDKLSSKDMDRLNTRAKAVGVTTGVVPLLADGFTGTLLRDIQQQLRIAKLFPMGQVNGGTPHDLIAVYGIEAFITNEAVDGTDSGENYITFVKTTKKIMTIVRKSYEVLDDALIDLAAEVRAGIVDSLSRAVEKAVLNGDISNTMDVGVAASSPMTACNGLRKAALGKATVDFTGAVLNEAQWLVKINQMQLAGGVYLDSMQVSEGNVVLIVDEATMYMFRTWDSFKTLDKAGRVATLFGGEVNSIFGIPVISTSYLPLVATTGKVAASGNTFHVCLLVNINTFKLFANGNAMSESDKNITNQTVINTGSLRFGFSSQYDSTEAAPNTIVATYKNAVAGINIAI